MTSLGDSVDFYKIGYQCFYGADGLALGKALLAAGKKVFFDLKLLDIDNTVEKGVAAIAATGATMLTVHAYPKAMRAAAKAAAGSELMVLGVTVLTSMDDADVRKPAMSATRRAWWRCGRSRRAMPASAGIVASPHEARNGAHHCRAETGHRHPRHPPGGRRQRRPEAGDGPAPGARRRAPPIWWWHARSSRRPIRRRRRKAILAEMAGGTRLA